MSIKISSNLHKQLLEKARASAESAYCVYSGFRVGAAVLMDDEIFIGCNVENASYGLTICAERVAIFSAVAAGKRKLKAIAISCKDLTSNDSIENRMPCGACRQIIAEFATPNLLIIIDGTNKDFSLEDLFPYPFILKVNECE